MEEKRKFKRWDKLFHEGVVMNEFTRDLDEIKHTKVRCDDVWVCSFPRSGTTLTQELVYLIQTLDFEQAEQKTLDERSPWIDVIHPDIPHFRYSATADSLPSPRVLKSHLHYFLLPDDLKKDIGKIIYVVRNPNACTLSFYKLMRYLGSISSDVTLPQYLSEFLDDKAMFCPWWLHVLQYWEHRHDNNVLFLQYEKLTQDKKGYVQKIADFLGKSLTEDDVAMIVDLTDPRSMRGNSKVNWEHHEQLFTTDKTHGQFINAGATSSTEYDIPEEIKDRMARMVQERLGHTDLNY